MTENPSDKTTHVCHMCGQRMTVLELSDAQTLNLKIGGDYVDPYCYEKATGEKVEEIRKFHQLRDPLHNAALIE